MWVPAIARPLSLFLLVLPLSTTSELSFSFLLPVWFLFTAPRACVYCVGCFHSSKCVHNIHLLRFRPFVNHYPPRVKSNGVLSAPPVFCCSFSIRCLVQSSFTTCTTAALVRVRLGVPRGFSCEVDNRTKGLISLSSPWHIVVFSSPCATPTVIRFLWCSLCVQHRVACFCVSLSDKKK